MERDDPPENNVSVRKWLFFRDLSTLSCSEFPAQFTAYCPCWRHSSLFRAGHNGSLPTICMLQSQEMQLTE